AALLATHDLFPSSGTRGGRTRHLHMAASADSMLDRDYGGIAFAVKKTLETRKQILIDFCRQVCAFPGQFFQARLQSFGLFIEISCLPCDRFLDAGRLLFLFNQVGLNCVGLHHQFELFILDLANFIFVRLHFVAQSLKFVVLPRLILLVVETREGLGACSQIESTPLTVRFRGAPPLAVLSDARLQLLSGSCRPSLIGFHHLSWTRTHADVSGEIPPADYSARLNEKLRRAPNIRPFGPGATMQ